MRKSLLFIIALVILAVPSINAHSNVKALIVLPYNYGANYFLIADELEKMGWDITITGLTTQIPPCPAFAAPFGCPTINVDMLISEIGDITEYDCLLISSSTRVNYDPCIDLINSSEALALIQTAVDENLTVAAYCTAVRVLAAADVIDGLNVTGNPNYQSEYEAAGATFVGLRIPPVTDGNIVTCARGDFFAPHNCDAVADCVETTQQAREGENDE